MVGDESEGLGDDMSIWFIEYGHDKADLDDIIKLEIIEME
jgi:hypothetical protein